jgi:tetratricopeptide (TPR) repeat protein
MSMHADPDQIVQQVSALLERRRTQQARLLLRPALASHPDHAGLLLQAAWTDYLDEQWDEALAGVRQVLLHEPHEQTARVLYFELLVQKKDYREAERVILELLREYPEHAHYYGRYASLMVDTLNLAKARQLAREGLKYDAEDAECLALQAICDFIEQPAGATSHALQQLLVRHPQSVRTLLLVAAALEERGDPRGAHRILQELVRAQPDNETLVSIARQLTVNTHWSMLPLWPMQRFGWAGSVGLWLIFFFGLRFAARANAPLAGTLAIVVLVYVVYSWTWPALLKRLMR